MDTKESANPIVAHAQKELRAAGLMDPKGEMYGDMLGTAVLDLVRKFAEQGHSGNSAHLTIELFSRVAAWKPLSPVTNDPEEWMQCGPDAWQNKRSPSVFSKDGGKTWYDLDEPIDRKHRDMVAVLAKSGIAILATLTAQAVDLWHHASCLPGEAGELFDAIKRGVIYGKEIDRANVIEELGDMEFYMEGVRRNLGITREETLQANYNKLSERYEGLRYTDAAAIARADKNPALGS